MVHVLIVVWFLNLRIRSWAQHFIADIIMASNVIHPSVGRFYCKLTSCIYIECKDTYAFERILTLKFLAVRLSVLVWWPFGLSDTMLSDCVEDEIYDWSWCSRTNDLAGCSHIWGRVWRHRWVMMTSIYKRQLAWTFWNRNLLIITW